MENRSFTEMCFHHPNNTAEATALHSYFYLSTVVWALFSSYEIYLYLDSTKHVKALLQHNVCVTCLKLCFEFIIHLKLEIITNDLLSADTGTSKIEKHYPIPHTGN